MNSHLSVTDEAVIRKIFFLRGKKVMLDEDLAALYNVETRRLNEQVKRNKERFPHDFMFQFSAAEVRDLMSQFATSSSTGRDSWGGRRKLPYAFTEQGVAMLSSVLKSQVAIEVNIRIIRVFTKMRELLLNNKDVLFKMEQIEGKIQRQGHRMDDYEKELKAVFQAIRQLLNPPQKVRKQIGFKTNGDRK